MLTYLKNRETTNKKHTKDSQNQKEKKSIMLKKTIKPQKEKEKEKGKKYVINRKIRFKMAINVYLLIITLNINRPNAPIKNQRED